MYPLIDLPVYDTYYAPNGTELIVDGNMEAPTTAAWTAALATLSKQVTTTSHLGSQCLRVAFNGVDNAGRASQTILTVGYTYVLSGWIRGDGVSYPRVQDGLGGLAWVGTVSTSWQYVYVVTPAAHARLDLYGWDLTGNHYSEFDDFSLQERFMYVRNCGTLQGKCQVGDGRTSTTCPTMLNQSNIVRCGASFDGGDYLQWMQTLSTGAYTVCFLVSRLSASAMYLLDAAAVSGVGNVQWNGSALTSTAGTLYVDDVATTSLPYGQVCLVSCAGITLSASSKLVFCASSALASPWVGNVYGIRLYPGTLTSRQLRDVRQSMLSRVNV